MQGLNKVYLVGFLGGDPEMQKSTGGKDYARMSLATHRPKKLSESEWETVTDWHNVTIWGKKAETCQKHLKKGDKVMVDGSLSHFEVTDKDGNKRKQTAITAYNVEFFPNTTAQAAS